MRNLVASVRQRLKNVADNSGRPFQDILQHYAMERFLYRLCQSPYREGFLLKGALMLGLWQGPEARATRDIDMQGRLDNSPEATRRAVEGICAQAVEEDGVAFDPASVEVSRIIEDGVYHGVRAKFWGNLGNIRLRMQMDVGFGDPVVAPPAPRAYPTILDLPAPVILGYSPESSISEKFEAMVKLGLMNDRVKDYYDIWLLSRRLDCRGELLAEAIRQTFAHRGTELVAAPRGLSSEYGEQEGTRLRWEAFLVRNQLAHASPSLDEVVSGVSAFLAPVAQALVAGDDWRQAWVAPGPWQPG